MSDKFNWVFNVSDCERDVPVGRRDNRFNKRSGSVNKIGGGIFFEFLKPPPS